MTPNVRAAEAIVAQALFDRLKGRWINDNLLRNVAAELAVHAVACLDEVHLIAPDAAPALVDGPRGCNKCWPDGRQLHVDTISGADYYAVRCDCGAEPRLPVSPTATPKHDEKCSCETCVGYHR